MLSSIIQFFIYLAETYGLLGIGIGMALESMGVPFGGIAIALAGVPLAERGETTYTAIVIVATIGTTVGSLISYYIGYFFGSVIRKFHHGKLIAREDILDRFVDSYGEGAVFFAQLFGASRSFISLPSGIVKMNMKHFLIGTVIGSLIINTIMVISGKYLFHKWQEISDYLGVPMWFSLIVSAIFILCVVTLYRRRLKDYIVKNGNNSPKKV